MLGLWMIECKSMMYYIMYLHVRHVLLRIISGGICPVWKLNGILIASKECEALLFQWASQRL